MKYIFELNHPKHYYQFKYVMQILKSRGHEISVLARDKDVLLNVLQEEHVGYTVFGKHRKTMLSKVLGTFGLMFKYIAIVKEQRPDVFVSKASWYGSAMAKIFHKKSVIFPDSEVVKVTNRYVVPMCTKVVTPDSFRLDYGSKHYRIKGIFEDCYLSPHVFQADEAVIEKYGLKRHSAGVRFGGWFANHDVGKSGFNQREKEELVQAISKNMNVYISSENDLPDELEPYRLPTPASVIHDVLSFADLYIGDSQTMASEAALLGTPAIRSNSFVGPNDMSNFIMLQEKYGLLYNVAEPAEAISLATDMSKNSRKVEWMEKRDKYYAQVGDCNAQIVELIERI